MTFLYFIGAIALLILVHEIGHFAAARLVGIEVEEFGIGFPPRALTLFEAKGTKYTLNWLPLGGFVRPKNMEDPDLPGGYAAASPWKRIVFLFAGSALNILTAFFIYSIIFYRLGDPILDQVVIVNVADNSPAAAAGLLPGDLILQVAETDIDSSEVLHTTIYDNLGQEVEIAYQRGEATETVSLIPRENPPENQGAIGIVMGNPSTPIPYPRAFALGVEQTYYHLRYIFSIPKMLLNNEITPDQGRFLGYKGMYDVFNAFVEMDQQTPAASGGGINTLGFMASITISLAILNMLPLPALDGGRILLILPELIFRKRVPIEYENAINFIGFALLILALIYINIQDFLNPVTLP
jgi:regulator of sigma E protease